MTGNYPFIVEITTASDNADDIILFDPEKNFVFSVICGAATFIVPTAGLDQNHEIDDTIPVLKIPMFISYAPDVCEIG